MLKIFLIMIIFLLKSTIVFAEKNLPSLEEITADLEAKKADLEPFNEKDVKIDLESLGLDDFTKEEKNSLDTKLNTKDFPKEPTTNSIKKINNDTSILLEEGQNIITKSSQNIKEETLKDLSKNEPKKEIIKEKVTNGDDLKLKIASETKNNEAKEIEANNPARDGLISKIQNFLNNNIVGEEKKSNNQNSKNENLTTQNNQKNKNSLKKVMKIEKSRIDREKIYEERNKKLQALRKKYLNKYDGDLEEKILPRQKDLNKFIIDEKPAEPIMSRYRIEDNLHIPIILTPEERIEILFNAASSGNVAFFNSAYEYVRNPNVKNKEGDNILAYLVMLQKHEIMVSILSKGANPNVPNALGYSPIDIAIELLDLESLEILIKNKARTDYVDAFGRTYLMHAARVGFLPAVQLFIAAGIDVNAMDDDGFTALSIAYRHKKEVIVQYLIKNGAKTWLEKPYQPDKQSLINELEYRW